MVLSGSHCEENMGIKSRSYDKALALIRKGVDIGNPLSIDVGDEVDTERISGTNVKIYPGCRIYGKETVISPGSTIGYETPATIDNCQLGPKVALKGGYFTRSVFLEKSNMGSGAQVRDGCILEEEAGGAHCVGIKQTILFPFVTLGSLINLCDCLMAGGTSRKNHSEVGSSYIHFNFTPDQDKATASLIGDVPRGVMLKQPAIFLGGQGGMVGPIRVGYGNVLAAGSILREDVVENYRLIVGTTHPGKNTVFRPRLYPDLRRVIEKNIVYVANLMALSEWYLHVRRPFFDSQELGPLVFTGALDKLEMAKRERIKRLQELSEKAKIPSADGCEKDHDLAQRNELSEKFVEIEALFTAAPADNAVNPWRDAFLDAYEKLAGVTKNDYTAAIQSLPSDISAKGTLWLQKMVDVYCEKTGEILPRLRLFGR
jgi:bifunctional UDP-N-acetylglucosamine pyrophosphorylase / glucosamine-1-phosphate N-acetyltransferase